MTPGGLLALDLGSETGWAYGSPLDAVPTTDRWVLPVLGGWVARCAALEQSLGDFLATYQPIQMVIEKALPPMAQTHINSAMQQYGLDTIARVSAYWISCPVYAIDPMTVRREITGLPPLASDAAKQANILYCKRQGIAVHNNHHEADAALTWLWYRRVMNGG